MNCPSCDKETDRCEIELSMFAHLSNIQVHIICTECKTEYGTFIYQHELTNYTKAGLK